MNLFQIIVLAGTGLVVGAVLAVLAYRFLRKIARNQQYAHIWLQVLKRLGMPLGILIVITVVSVALPVDEIKGLPLDLHTVISICFNVVLAWLCIIGITNIRTVVMAKYDITSKNNLKARKMQTQLVVIERILIVLVLLIAFSVTLLSFPKIRQVGVSLLASAGIAGIIIGFAAQQSISMFLAGFQIAFTQPIRLDDVVIVEGEWGWIEEITLTYVVVRIWDKRRLIVPINYFIEKPFQNWTRTSAEIMGTVFIYVDYGFPVDKMREELTRILKEADEWDGKVNVLQVTDSREHTMELRALMSSVDSPTSWDLRVKVREKLIGFVQQQFPQYLPNTRVIFPEKVSFQPASEK